MSKSESEKLVAVILPEQMVDIGPANWSRVEIELAWKACKRALRPEPPTLEELEHILETGGNNDELDVLANWAKHVLVDGWEVE